MKCHEIFGAVSADLADEIIRFLHKNQRPLLETTILALAEQQRVRSVFVSRKPWRERGVWLANALSRRINEGEAVRLLQTWLFEARKELLCFFLDTLGIEHDGEGAVEDLPDEPDEAAIKDAVEKTLEKFPREHVAVYLHAFSAAEPEAWPKLPASSPTMNALLSRSKRGNGTGFRR